jgi:PPOX class probable F420-dependent enzyme
MTEGQARDRFAGERVARLATADATGRPHLVPIVFAVVGDTVYSAVDAKPKRTQALRRLANVAANPNVALLADAYDEDWTALWWVRAEGRARTIERGGDEEADAFARLTERYAQYVAAPPPGPVLAIDVERWAAWEAGA